MLDSVASGGELVVEKRIGILDEAPRCDEGGALPAQEALRDVEVLIEGMRRRGGAGNRRDSGDARVRTRDERRV